MDDRYVAFRKYLWLDGTMNNIPGRYPAHTYTVSLLGAAGPATLIGGFSEVSGLSITPTRKITGIHSVNDVTLKRGVVDSSSLWNWLSQVRSSGGASHRSVVITLRNIANNPVQTWKLGNAKPKKYTGPALGGKGHDTAVEELVLSAESIEIIPPR